MKFSSSSNRIFAAAAGVAALALVAGVADRASAAQLTIDSVVPQSGFLGTTGASNPLTGTPYDYTGQGYNNLTSIDSISITLTMSDGKTGVGELDRNNLTLGLDGFDTGIKLNDFMAGNIVTLTLSGPIANASQILAALKADGQLVGSVLDATPGDSMIGLSARLDTELGITGTLAENGGGGQNVPLPAAVLIAPLGATLAGTFARRMRKA